MSLRELDAYLQASTQGKSVQMREVSIPASLPKMEGLRATLAGLVDHVTAVCRDREADREALSQARRDLESCKKELVHVTEAHAAAEKSSQAYAHTMRLHHEEVVRMQREVHVK